MTSFFGRLEDGSQARLYTLTGFGLTAQVTDFGATLVRLLVPDAGGTAADVVLGYDQVSGYARGTGYLGATVGRNANRIAGAAFLLDGTEVRLAANEGPNSLHSGPEGYSFRLWQTEALTESSVTFRLQSPHGDQGFPGNATVWVTYALEPPRALRITYRGECDRNTVFNLTNHSYFNLAGQDRPELAMDQLLTLPAKFFHPTDASSIPTGGPQLCTHRTGGAGGSPFGPPDDADHRLPRVAGVHRQFPPGHRQGGHFLPAPQRRGPGAPVLSRLCPSSPLAPEYWENLSKPGPLLLCLTFSSRQASAAPFAWHSLVPPA